MIDSRHASKHGKDVADVSLAIAKRVIEQMRKSEAGFVDPKKQLVQVRKILDLQYRSAVPLKGMPQRRRAL